MTKLTPRDLSRADFEEWRDTPFFQTLLTNEIEEADEAITSLALSAVFADGDAAPFRKEAIAMAGMKRALTMLQELQYEDLVEVENAEG